MSKILFGLFVLFIVVVGAMFYFGWRNNTPERCERAFETCTGNKEQCELDLVECMEQNKHGTGAD